MQNKFEKRGGHDAIFAGGGGMQHEILVDEADFKIVDPFPRTWHANKNGKTFYAQIKVRSVDGKRVFLGCFDTRLEAEAAVGMLLNAGMRVKRSRKRKHAA